MLTIAVVGQKGPAIADVVGSFQPAERLFAAVLPAADPACLRTLADLRAGFAGDIYGYVFRVWMYGIWLVSLQKERCTMANVHIFSHMVNFGHKYVYPNMAA